VVGLTDALTLENELVMIPSLLRKRSRSRASVIRST